MRLVFPVCLAFACAHCGDIESLPMISTGVVAAAALFGGGAVTSDGKILEGLGLTVVGGALLVGAYSIYADDVSKLDLEDERPEIRLALARGDGVFVTDLASALHLPPRDVPCLGRTLQAARPVLTRSMAQPLRGVQAAAFVDELRRVLQAEPLLASALAKRRLQIEQAFRARAAATILP